MNYSGALWENVKTHQIFRKFWFSPYVSNDKFLNLCANEYAAHCSSHLAYFFLYTLACPIHIFSSINTGFLEPILKLVECQGKRTENYGNDAELVPKLGFN